MSCIDKILDQIMQTRAPRHHLPLDTSEDWDDAVSAQRADDSTQTINDPGDRNQHVYRRLGHLTVNPNQELTSKALASSYVFSGIDRDGYVNTDEKSAKEFVNKLIHAAILQRQIERDRSNTERASHGHNVARSFILHGDRGTGKTFFLNYLLTKFSDLFDKSNVVWVRVNLVANFDDENLPHWIAAQATKVLLRYYDEASSPRPNDEHKQIPLDILTHLDQYITKEYANDLEMRIHLKSKLTIMKRVFVEEAFDQPLTPSLVPELLALEVLKYARTKGLSFIVVLDGLDRLDITRAAKRKFDALQRGVDAIANAYESSGFALLIVSRTKTMEGTEHLNSDPFTRQFASCHPVGVAPLLDIVERRLEVIEKEVPSLEKKYGWEMGDWNEHINDFRSRILKSKFLGQLNESLEIDRRAQMQMIQQDYIDFLRFKHDRAYLLLEYLTKAGKKYPPRYYSYAFDERKKWCHAGVDEPSQYDSKFIPTIFSFPRLYGNTKYNPPHCDAMLHGVRIAQIIATHQVAIDDATRNSSITVPDELSGEEIATMCEVCFQYNKDITYLFLEEFAEFGMIDLHGDLFTLPASPEAYTITMKPKLRHLIEDNIYAIAYLSLAAMRTPIAESTLLHEKTFGYFKADSLDQKGDLIQKASANANWLFTKIINCIGLVRLIDIINTRQSSAINDFPVDSLTERQRSILSRSIREVGQSNVGMFELPDEMKGAILAQLKASTHRFADDHDQAALRRLLKRIKKHFELWDQVEYKIP